MMRSDGAVVFFLCQHWQTGNARWVETALSHVLFDKLTYQDSNGVVGDRYRELLHPQSASSDLWQKYGIQGYANREDAEEMLTALRNQRPEMTFRIVKRHIMQTTEDLLEEV
jgi:hypothetical protein